MEYLNINEMDDGGVNGISVQCIAICGYTAAFKGKGKIRPKKLFGENLNIDPETAH